MTLAIYPDESTIGVWGQWNSRLPKLGPVASHSLLPWGQLLLAQWKESKLEPPMEDDPGPNALRTVRGFEFAPPVADDPGITPDPSFGLELPPLPSSFDFVSHPVPLDSNAADRVLGLVQRSLPKARLLSLRRFGNPWLWDCYQRCAEQVAKQNNGEANKQLLFHGDLEPHQILGTGLAANSDGFEFRLSLGGQYGHGSYFTKHVVYPIAIHPRRSNADGSFSLILAEVALGSVHDYGDDCQKDLRIPPLRGNGTANRHHSVAGTEDGIAEKQWAGYPAGKHNGKQFVVYDRHQAYPHFLLTLSCRPTAEELGVRPGTRVALYNPFCKRLIQMTEKSTIKASAETVEEIRLETWLACSIPERTWECFTVVDAGNGHIALHSTFHKHFLRLVECDDCGRHMLDGDMSACDAQPERSGADRLMDHWWCERFIVVDAGCGAIALYGVVAHRFLRMQHAGYNQDGFPTLELPTLDGGSGRRNVDDLPPASKWPCERFRVVPHPIRYPDDPAP